MMLFSTAIVFHDPLAQEQNDRQEPLMSDRGEPHCRPRTFNAVAMRFKDLIAAKMKL